MQNITIYVYITHMRETEAAEEIRVLTCTYREFSVWNHENLSAPYWRIYWNDRPGWNASLGHASIALSPSRIIVIPPETPFSAQSRNPAGHLYIHFVASRVFAPPPACMYEIPVDNHHNAIISELTQLAGAGEEIAPRAVILTRILCWEALRAVPQSLWPQTGGDPRIARAMRTMELLTEHPPANAELAVEAGMNTNSFIRLFHEQTGVSPQAWCARRRIEQACSLLHHSPLSIDHIAEKTGFCDRAHFSRVFARYRGMGPGEFRRKGIAAGSQLPARTDATRSAAASSVRRR